MKIRELLEKLDKLDPKLDPVCFCEDEKLLTERRGFVLFDISAVDTVQVERHRLEDGTPYLKFEQGPESRAIAILEIASDF